MLGNSGEEMDSFAIEDDERFEFGKNWQRFLLRLNDERIHEAEYSLKKLLHKDSLSGFTFLDIGCGSGLFSLAALRLGAKRVLSFDYDPQSVACTRSLKQKLFPGDDRWEIMQGSILDDDLMKNIGKWDIVYSWGVLHHTGEMWKGLNNAMMSTKTGGYLFIAIYNDQGITSRLWWRIKKTYNQFPSYLRFLIVIPSFIRLWVPTLIRDLIRGRPLQKWKNYYRVRGMSPWDDVIDWVGGYPFEVAKPEEVFHFCHAQCFELVELVTTNNLGCNQFVFIRRK